MADHIAVPYDQSWPELTESTRLAFAEDRLERDEAVLAGVFAERRAQDAKWGPKQHAPTTWLAILTEEVGEVAKAMNDNATVAEIRKELIQVAAVAVAAVNSIDFETGLGFHEEEPVFTIDSIDAGPGTFDRRRATTEDWDGLDWMETFDNHDDHDENELLGSDLSAPGESELRRLTGEFDLFDSYMHDIQDAGTIDSAALSIQGAMTALKQLRDSLSAETFSRCLSALIGLIGEKVEEFGGNPVEFFINLKSALESLGVQVQVVDEGLAEQMYGSGDPGDEDDAQSHYGFGSSTPTGPVHKEGFSSETRGL